MKKIIVIAVAAIALSSLALGQKRNKPTPNSGIEQQVMNLERELHRAINDSNTATVERLEANDFKLIQSDGNEIGREFDVQNTSTKVTRLESGNPEEMNVRVYRDTAVVTGRLVNRVREERVYKFTDVWVKRQGRWQIVVSHYTQMK